MHRLALGLDEDDMPEINEETLPDEEAMARLGVVEAVEKFKLPVYGDNGDEESAIGNGKASNASKKRKPVAENTAMESAKSYCSCKLIVTPSASKLFLLTCRYLNCI
ncbi:hypothetical protein POTOM_025508 [Populus tomentosa]|uniref:Ku70/Ku80 C-terminal arm domain-containing protein n=1 Tax=Populus tomentosa TaxID=118781 RepID=A0A8X7ZL75_POPTO|nr:hypothetical protein POTOM_025508 [Populus tomentosa]